MHKATIVHDTYIVVVHVVIHTAVEPVCLVVLILQVCVCTDFVQLFSCFLGNNLISRVLSNYPRILSGGKSFEYL